VRRRGTELRVADKRLLDGALRRASRHRHGDPNLDFFDPAVHVGSPRGCRQLPCFRRQLDRLRRAAAGYRDGLMVRINDVELETRRRLIAGRNSDVSFTVARSQQKKSDDRKWAQHAVNLESIQAARQEAGGGMSGRRRWPVRETRALSGPCLGG